MIETFLANLESHFEENLEGIGPLQKLIREKAWSRFTELGLPTKSHAGYQYFPLNQFFSDHFELSEFPEIDKEHFQSLIFPTLQQSHIVFVNGQYSPKLSDTSALPKEVVVLRLHDSLNHFGNFLQVRLSKALKEETDPLVLLNIAMIQMGLFFYVPPGVQIEQPIQCLHLISSDRPCLISPRIHLFLGKEAKLHWISETVCVKDFEYFSNSVLDITLEEGADLTHTNLISPCKNGWYFEAVRATQKRDSRFRSITATSGTKAARQDFHVSLQGENASCDLKGVALLTENRQAHANVHMEHKAPYCTSNQLFKNILSDASRSSFEGKIYVHPEAQKTMAYQLNNNLLLSDTAIANSKPNLEIFADDVKASHGATVSQVRPDHLFYLKSRGISTTQAKNMLLASFARDIIQEVPFAPARDRMLQIAERYLG